VPIAAIVNHGFAVASVDYRLSPVAAFPAQAYDIKAAVRFLRNHSEDYGIDPDRIAIAGASAGGHLAALVGMSNRVRELEGRTGRDGDVSSDVQAVVSFYGASNLQTILAQSTPHGLSVRVPALQLLLKGQPEDKQQLAKLASPVSHVDRDDPPLLLIHGDQDPQMPINQSHELHGACRERGVTVEFDVVYGAAHGGSEFYTDARIRRVAEFLRDAMPTD
jgi:acetyl esterase/lipase